MQNALSTLDVLCVILLLLPGVFIMFTKLLHTLHHFLTSSGPNGANSRSIGRKNMKNMRAKHPKSKKNDDIAKTLVRYAKRPFNLGCFVWHFSDITRCLWHVYNIFAYLTTLFVILRAKWSHLPKHSSKPWGQNAPKSKIIYTIAKTLVRYHQRPFNLVYLLKQFVDIMRCF